MISIISSQQNTLKGHLDPAMTKMFENELLSENFRIELKMVGVVLYRYLDSPPKVWSPYHTQFSRKRGFIFCIKCFINLGYFWWIDTKVKTCNTNINIFLDQHTCSSRPKNFRKIVLLYSYLPVHWTGHLKDRNINKEHANKSLLFHLTKGTSYR